MLPRFIRYAIEFLIVVVGIALLASEAGRGFAETLLVTLFGLERPVASSQTTPAQWVLAGSLAVAAALVIALLERPKLRRVAFDRRLAGHINEVFTDLLHDFVAGTLSLRAKEVRWYKDRIAAALHALRQGIEAGFCPDDDLLVLLFLPRTDEQGRVVLRAAFWANEENSFPYHTSACASVSQGEGPIGLAALSGRTEVWRRRLIRGSPRELAGLPDVRSAMAIPIQRDGPSEDAGELLGVLLLASERWRFVPFLQSRRRSMTKAIQPLISEIRLTLAAHDHHGSGVAP